MAVKDSVTEAQIKEAAKKLFFREGRFKATTQEIADAAGVNRTLVNYYFRSRDQLFDQVLKDARDSVDSRMNKSMETAKSFREKLELFIDFFLEQSFNYPYLDLYMLSRINDDVDKQNEIISNLKKTERLKHFLKDIEDEMKKGTIETMPPVQFFFNLMSLLTYPMIMQSLFKKILNYSDKQYRQLMMERRELILKILLRKG
ncbi:TetR/AcrR family transcriptional regulator [Pollutibacter soli]|uniref:TetR/AcrR family transcriptional regulator n=1 Tax=Pollutibacter soli TaxID=3034157 RepID=UPI003013D096